MRCTRMTLLLVLLVGHAVAMVPPDVSLEHLPVGYFGGSATVPRSAGDIATLAKMSEPRQSGAVAAVTAGAPHRRALRVLVWRRHHSTIGVCDRRAGCDREVGRPMLVRMRAEQKCRSPLCASL